MLRITVLPILLAIFYILPVRLQPQGLLKLAFFLWLLGGISLSFFGASRLSASDVNFSDINTLLILTLAIIIGIAKGKFVLAKTSQRNIERLLAFSEPQKLFHVYSVRSWIIIGLMLLISDSLTFFHAPLFWRGTVNLAVGLALIMSSLNYLKTCCPQHHEPTHSS